MTGNNVVIRSSEFASCYLLFTLNKEIEKSNERTNIGPRLNKEAKSKNPVATKVLCCVVNNHDCNMVVIGLLDLLPKCNSKSLNSWRLARR